MFQLLGRAKMREILNCNKSNNSAEGQCKSKTEKAYFRPLIYVCSNLSDPLLVLISETQLFSQCNFLSLQLVANITVKQFEFHHHGWDGSRTGMNVEADKL